MGVSGVAVTSLAAGGVFLYGGIRGKSPLQATQAIIQGAGPGSVPQTQAITAPAGTLGSGDFGASVVEIARSQEGKPYIWDSPSSWKDPNPKGFDCSGLTGWSYYHAARINLPHFSQAQRAKLHKKSFGEALPGDLVFFHTLPGVVGHVAVYDGAGAVIEAPFRGQPVRRRAINSRTSGMFPNNVGAFPGGTEPSGTPVEASAASNMALARMHMPGFGWDSAGAEWNALYALWNQESGWSNTADTRKTGLDPAGASVYAYGIAQARPASKYPQAGRPPDLGGRSDPLTQILWGLRYIRSRYGSPTAAEAHEQSNGWY